MKFIYSFFIIFFIDSTFAGSDIPKQLTVSTGSISLNYSENSSTTTPYSGTASALPFAITYEYFPNLQRAYFVKAIGPLVASSSDRYFSGTIGTNFFFGKVASQATVKDLNFEMKILPKFRYYAGPSIGLGYFIYNTSTATKNDILFELGGHAGSIYTINSRWGLRGEVGFARGTGALVSATIIKINLGAIYTLPN